MSEFNKGFDVGSPDVGAALKLTGRECLAEICRTAKVLFGAHTVTIGSLRVVEAEHLFFEAFSSDAINFDTTGFPTRNTPCFDVLQKGEPIAILDNATKQYPEAAFLRKLKSKAYVGFPLINAKGCEFGVLALKWSEAIAPTLVENVKTAIGPYLHRISDELRRVTTSHAIETMISPVGPSAMQNDEIFRMIVKQAVELTGVQAVVLVKSCGDGPSVFKILAAYSEGTSLEKWVGEDLPYNGSPCGKMIESDVFFQERGVLNDFPHLELLRSVSAEAYLGFGFRDSAGQTIGHIAFVHDRPMSSRACKCQLMRMISSRAGQELQRFDLELERNSMDTALRVRSKLESLGIMAGTIAHDFNNQLAAMIGNTELALMEMAPQHPSLEYLRAAEESMWRARDVIGELMDFAGNNPSAAAEPIALGEIVSSAVSEFIPVLEGDGNIRIQIEGNFPKIMGRRVQLIQILSNLIANALDASKPGKHPGIEIKAGMANCTSIRHEKCLTGHCAEFPDRCVFLEVSDKGRGMDSATAERVFDPYFSTKGVSRGLGLSSVLGLAKRLGIGLTFESKPHRGTVFRLYFSKLAEDTALALGETTPEPEHALPAPQRKSILVVDDEKDVQDVVFKLMKTLGHEVHRASSGEDAIELARTIPALDLAIVDVVMPGMNGVTTVSELRRMNQGLPAILVSGFSQRNLSESLVQDDRTKFLVKPFSIKNIRETVTELVL
ncbi:response regulator [Tateyamaria sp.]|uniref:hybrid sensor histidine kinase/response regulator n=1 Tax=Tateyamaria sp. TaxID=1929288 RepID=UPI00329E4C2D